MQTYPVVMYICEDDKFSITAWYSGFFNYLWCCALHLLQLLLALWIVSYLLLV